MIRYFLEMAKPCGQTYRWEQVGIGNDLEQLKRVAGNKHRVLDVENSFKEVYRTAPDNHFGIMALVNGFNN